MICEVPADEVVFTPLHVGIFFSLLTAVDGGGIAEIKAKLQQDYLSTLVTELVVWPGCGALPRIPPALVPHVAPRASASQHWIVRLVHAHVWLVWAAAQPASRPALRWDARCSASIIHSCLPLKPYGRCSWAATYRMA